MSKSTSGKPYIKPSGRPTFAFNLNGTVIEAFENMTGVEVFQKSADGHEQRVLMTPSNFTNFHNMLTSAGFVLQ
jgi:hypothetical protein